jgi:phage-related protein
LGDVAGSFQTVLGPIVDGILHLFESIDWGAVGQTLLSGLSSAFTALTGAASGALGLGASLLSMLTSAFQSIDWASVGQTILAGLGTAFAALSTGAGMAVNFGQQLYSMILSQVTTTDWSGIAASITGGLTAAMNSATSAVGGAGNQDGIIGKLFGDATTILAGLQPVLDAVMGALQPIITNLQTSFAPVMAQLQLSWQQLQPTIQALMPTLEALGVIVGATLVVALGLLLGALGGITGMMTGVLPGAIQAATGVLQIFGGLVETVSALISGVIKVIIDLLQGDWMGAWNDAKTAVQGMADGVTQIISGLGNVISGLISGMIGSVEGLISGFIGSIVVYFQSLYDSLVGHSIIPDMINGIIAAFEGMPGQIIGIVSGFIAQILGMFSDLATQMLAKGGEMIANLASGITGGIGAVTGAIGNVIASVQGAFSGAATWLLSAGSDVIMGLANGIGNAAGQAAGAAERAAHSVVNAVKGALGINSPSTVMIEVGHNIIEGLSIGLSQTDALIKAADSSSNQLVNAMITGITNGVSSDTMVPRLTAALLPSLLAAQQNAADALDLAKVSGASDDDLAKLQAKLDAATSLIQRWQEFNQQTVDQFVKAATDAANAQDAQDALAASWGDTFQNFNSILDGTLIPQLKDKLASLTTELQVALSQHVPQSIIDGIQQSIATTTQQIQQAGQVIASATDAGIIQPIKALSDAAVDQVKKLMGQMKDGGASLIDSIVSGVESGQVKLNQAMQLIPNSALPKIQEVIDKLKDDLASALLKGTDPGPIEANIDILTKLFAALASAAGQSADAVKQAAVAIGDFVEGKGYKTDYGYTNVKPGSSSSGGGSGGGGGGGAASSGLPNGTPKNVQNYYDKYYTPDELTYYVQNGKAITTPKVTDAQREARQNNPNTFATHGSSQGGTTIHGDIYVTQPQSTSLDDLLRGVVPA